MRDAIANGIMRHSTHRSARVEPIPLITINTRKLVLADPVKTRIGVGNMFIDHAAGLPLRSRVQSAPPAARHPVFYPQSASAWDDVARVRDTPVLRQQPWRGVDAPVRLPMRSGVLALLGMIALIAAFAGVLASVYLAGRSATAVHPESATPDHATPVVPAPSR
jgi:hypothetical protein